MTQRTQRENVKTTIDQIECWTVSAKFIRYAGGRKTSIYMRRSHILRRSKHNF